MSGRAGLRFRRTLWLLLSMAVAIGIAARAGLPTRRDAAVGASSPIPGQGLDVSATTIRRLDGAAHATQPRPPQSRSRRITGSVHAADGQPLFAALVCEFDSEAASNDAAQCTKTDRDGRFTLELVLEVVRPERSISAVAVGFLQQIQTVQSPEQRSGSPSEVAFWLRPASASIEGSVVDALGGFVPGATVIASTDASHEPIFSAATDSNGRFLVSAEAGLVSLEIRADSYAPSRVTVRSPALGVVVVLSPSSSIDGQVVSKGTGSPVAQVSIVGSNQQVFRKATTDAAGRFTLMDLSAGAYQIVASAPEWRSEPALVSVGVADVRQSVVIEVEPATGLTSTVTIAGQPCPEGMLEVQGPSSAASAILNGSGRLDGLSPGDYDVQVYCAGGVPRREQVHVGSTPIALQWDLASGLEVEGRVEDYDGNPLPQTVVRIRPAGGGRAGTQCTTGDAGEFVCTGLTPGDYDCEVGEDILGTFEAVHFSLEHSVGPIVLRGKPWGTIHVTVRSGAGGGSVDPRVLARQRTGPPMVASPRDGVFVLDRLPLGSYRVFVPPESSAGEAAIVELQRAGQLATVELALSSPRSIAGRVLDSAESPVADAWVEAMFIDPMISALTAPIPPVLTNEQGEFSVLGLRPGRYDLVLGGGDVEGRLEGVEAGEANLTIVASARTR